jgi:hypothetical protein
MKVVYNNASVAGQQCITGHAEFGVLLVHKGQSAKGAVQTHQENHL